MSTNTPASAGSLINHTVIAAMGGRLWQFLAGPVTLVLIAKFLTPAEQGFFYAFAGYLGIQAFFELGLAGVLVSVAGHEMVLVDSADPETSLRGRRRLADLTHRSLVWYTACSVLFAIVALGSGWVFFTRQTPDVAWSQPWVLLVAIASFNLWLTPLLAILEGTGAAYSVYRNRVLQSVLGSFFVWGSLALGLGLWTTVTAAAVQAVVQLLLVIAHRQRLFGSREARAEDAFPWRETVVPMQWRIAIQGIALYLATQSFTLVLMEARDAVTAGRWGMTWSVLFTIQALATAWFSASLPHATRLSALGQSDQLRRYWTRVAVASATLVAVGIIALYVILLTAGRYVPWFADRFIEPSNVLIFGAGMVAYQIAAAQGYYVRAQRRESLYWAATVGQVTIAAACWYGGILGGVDSLCLAYAASSVGVLLPLHSFALWRDPLLHQNSV